MVTGVLMKRENLDTDQHTLRIPREMKAELG